MLTSYRSDPRWQAAQKVFIDPAGANSEERLIQRTFAATKMCALEEIAELNGGAA